MNEYLPEYQAPVYSVLGKAIVGLTVETTVVVDGEVSTFVTPLATYKAVQALRSSTSERHDNE